MRALGWTTAGALGAVLAGGCGSGGDTGGVERAIAPPQDIVHAIPDPFDRSARPAAGTYAGRIGAAGRAYMGAVVRGDRAVVYLCDGRASEWFGARVRDGRVRVRSARGTVVDARLTGGALRGRVQPEGQPAGQFVARAARTPGVGVFAGPDPAVPGRVRRWIVLTDGVRGVSETPVLTADATAGSGTATKTGSTTTSAPPGTTTSATLQSDATSGSGTAVKTRPATTTTTSSTPVSTVTTPTTTTTSTIADGSSNTILLGESTQTQTTATTTPPRTTTTSTIADGSSNTILLGETPVNGVAAGDGSVRQVAPAATTCPSSTGCETVATTFSLTTATKPITIAKDGPRRFFAGGSLLTCRTLERLARSLAAPARAGDTTARAQLRAVLEQAKANGC